MRIKPGNIRYFDGSVQYIYDMYDRHLSIQGRHMFYKLKDSLLDKIRGYSWYLMDNKHVVRLNSYIEERCLYEEERE